MVGIYQDTIVTIYNLCLTRNLEKFSKLIGVHLVVIFILEKNLCHVCSMLFANISFFFPRSHSFL